MSTLLFVCLILASGVNLFTAIVVETTKQPGKKTKSTADHPSKFVVVSFALFLLALVVLVPGLFWINGTAPPEYVSKKMAQAYDPECLQHNLSNTVQSRPLSREDVIRANGVCKDGSRKGVAIRVLQKEVINAEDGQQQK